MLNDLLERANRHLRQLSPHIREREAGQIISALVAALHGDKDCGTCTYAALRETEDPCYSCIKDVRVYRNHEERSN